MRCGCANGAPELAVEVCVRPLRSGACGGGPCCAHSVRSGTCSCGGEAEKAKEKEKEEKEKEKEEKEKEEEEKNSDKIYLTTLTCQVRKTCSCRYVNLEVNRWMSQPHRNTSRGPSPEAGQVESPQFTAARVA